MLAGKPCRRLLFLIAFRYLRLPAKLGQCRICGEYFSSLKALKTHKSNTHRITDNKIMAGKADDSVS
ncbi:C2H2-type zinc finger protein [Candidatus Nitrososphaera sp. FF02]|uniref:C2H2-type zinc finger protein n=1 Tax=Candidatus Nitrososphaera sp. FF02 TaxID=3398226 RepID=UPI0039E821D0